MRFFLAGIIILLLSTCLSEPDCLVTATNNLRISLKNGGTGTAQKALFSSIKVSGTSATFFSTDSVTTLILPVDPLATRTTFKFQYGTVLNSKPVVRTDSITVTYATQIVIISPTCGAAIYHTNLTVSATSFVIEPKVVNSQLSTRATSNIEIKL